MIEYDGEQYLTVREVAERFQVSRGTCISNILARVNKCYLPGRKHALYRLSDLEQFSQVRIVEKPCSALPVSATETETGSQITSTHSSLKWTGTASIPNSFRKNNRKEA
jgi:hypothetical protein